MTILIMPKERKARKMKFTEICRMCKTPFKTNRTSRKFCNRACRYEHWNLENPRIRKNPPKAK